MYSVYLVRCADGSLYTGISTDPLRRVHEHNTGTRASAYTRSRRPVVLVYTQSIGTKSEALKEEARIKELSKREKEMLITSHPLPLAGEPACR